MSVRLRGLLAKFRKTWQTSRTQGCPSAPIRAQPASLWTRTALRTAERLLCACSDTPEGLSALMHDSWQTEPSLRPTFKEVRPSSR